MNDQHPLPYRIVAPALIHCVISTIRLLARDSIHLPRQHIGKRLHFVDGTVAQVYRETVVDGTPRNPCALLVEFRLWPWAVRGHRTHALFRWESLLNTPLFVGFPGFASKLWLANDEHGVYRGVYEWDGPERAEHYARSLWRVLALGCEPDSIHYRVLPGVRRDALLAAPHLYASTTPDLSSESVTGWWRSLEVA